MAPMSDFPFPATPSPFDAETLDRYIAGEASPAEVAAIERAFAKDATLREVASAMRTFAPGTHTVQVRDDTEARLAQVLASSEHSIRVPQQDPLRRPNRAAWLGAAAVAVMVGMLALQSVRHAGDSSSRKPSRIYTTTVGQRATITLADASRIVLAPASQLIVPSGFGTATRTVALRGEAFFTVKTASANPFVVRTGTVTTRVLGTMFDIRQYPGDRTVHVAVISGRVAAGGIRTSATLSAGAVAEVTDSTATRDMQGDPAATAAWTSGTLAFTNAPVPVMLATVGRWYGYEFRLADSALANQHVTTSLVVDQPATLMSMLKDLLDVTMTFNGNVVTLHPRQGHTSSYPSRARPVRHGITTSSEVGK